jgi:phytanoyl-CoA hydroxylase
MHDLDPVFERFSYTPVLQSLLSRLGFEKPILIYSMFIFKNQIYGTKVDMHTDMLL